MPVPSKKFLLISLLILITAVTIPLITQAAFSLSLSTTPIGGKISMVIPNPPTIAMAPNPCYKPNSYLITLGPPSAGEYILDGDVDVINGTNPPMVSVWSLGLASQGLSACKEIDVLIGVGGIF